MCRVKPEKEEAQSPPAEGRLSQADIEGVANAVMRKINTRERYLAARFLRTQGRYAAPGCERVAPDFLETDTQMELSANGDYNRVATLYLLAREVEEAGLQGAVAELGVYRGDFAAYIGRFFPGRDFYLFDTFEGFDRDQARRDELEHGGRWENFEDTSVEDVLARIPDPGRCRVRKGFFPETASGMEENFVFVSLDADLYEPTRAGLEFFYPRLAGGGYMMIHDYGSRNYPGCRKAVEEFCRGRSLPRVPAIDGSASVIIAKARG